MLPLLTYGGLQTTSELPYRVKHFSLNVVDPMGKVLYTHAHTQTPIMVLLSIPVYDQCQNLMQLCADMGANVSPLRIKVLLLSLAQYI